MALKNQALTVCYVAWNTSTNSGQTADATNHTIKLVQDGTAAAPTNSPAEVSSANAPGVYSLALTAGDMNFNCVVLCGKSSTSNVAIIPLVIVTESGVLPHTACTTNASLLTSGTGTDQLSVSAGKVILQATQTGVTIPTVTTVTNQLTAAQIATGVWQDATAGDFTVASSIGKALFINAAPGAAGGHFIAGTNAATTITTGLTTTFTGNLTGSVASVSGAVGSVTGNVGGNVTGSVGSVTGLTNATIATAVWTDTTAGDFTTATSPGKIIFAQLGGAFTTTSSSVFTTASLANAPTGGSAPTAAQVATAVWQDATAGDFTVASSIGKALYIANVVPGAAGGHFIAGTNAATTVNITGSLSGSVGSVTGAVGSVAGSVASVTGAVGSVTAVVSSNVTQWSGSAVVSPNVSGVPIVDIGYSNGIAFGEGSIQSATSTTAVLDPSASSLDGYYTGGFLSLDAGTGSGQPANLILGYVGSTKTATFARTWITTPDNTSKYSIGGSADTMPYLGGTLGTPRALDSIADGSITLNDALWCAVANAAGKEDASSGSNLVIKTPSGTTIRTFVLTTTPINPFGLNFPVSRS